MASMIPPKKNTAYTCYVSLVSQADTKLFQDNPTLAAGDVKVSVDGASPANIGTLPTAVTGLTRVLTVALTAGEMNGDNIVVLFHDAAGAEWCDLILAIQTSPVLYDDLPTAAEIADAVWDETSTGHTGADKAGRQVWTTIDAIIADTGTDGVLLAEGSIVEKTIAANAITAAKIAADAITAAKIATDAITAAKIAASAIGASELAADAVAEIADAVWDEILSGHTTASSVAEALSDIAAYCTGSTPVAGACQFTYTLTSSVDGTPIPEARVWVTSDSAGTVLLASGTTDANGQVTFYLSAGTVYLWRQKAGWNFTNPDTETVS